MMGKKLALHFHLTFVDCLKWDKAHALVPLFFDGRNARALLPPLLFDFLVESNSSAVMGETLALQSHRRFGRIFRWERTSRFNPITVRPDFSMGENLALQSHRCSAGFFDGRKPRASTPSLFGRNFFDGTKYAPSCGRKSQILGLSN